MNREGWGLLSLISGFVFALFAVLLISGSAWAGFFTGVSAMLLGILLLFEFD